MAELRLGGNTSPVRFQNKGVSGITLSAYLVAALVNVALDADDVLANKVTVKVSLTRYGVTRTMVNADLRTLHKACNYHTLGYNAVLAGASGFTQEVLHTGVVKGVISVPFTIDFKNTYQLSGDDKLEVELTYDSSTTFTADIDGTVSGFYVDTIDSDAPESGTPYITVESVTPGQSNIQTTLPANTTGVYFVNNDKTTERNTDSVLSAVAINYSTGKVKADYRQLCHLRKAYSVISSNRAQTFQIASFGRYGVTNATLDITLNSANVTASNNFIVYFHNYVDSRLLKNGDYQESLNIRASLDGMKINA